MGNRCQRYVASLCGCEDDEGIIRRGESSTYYPLSEASDAQVHGENSSVNNYANNSNGGDVAGSSSGGVEGKDSMSDSFPVPTGSDLASKLLSSPHSLPPSLEEEKAYNLAKSMSPSQCLPRECLLCMEFFTEERPEVRTLCACGVNKNAYHLECLLAWRSKSGNTMCPVCNKELFYEEGMQAEQESTERSSNSGTTSQTEPLLQDDSTQNQVEQA